MNKLLLASILCLTALASSAQPVLRGPLTTNSPAVKPALDGGRLDALTNNWFRVPVGGADTNLVVTNLAIGQVIRVDLFVTNGFTATFAQQTALNSAQGYVQSVWSNQWATVFISKPAAGETNFDVRANGNIEVKGTLNVASSASVASLILPNFTGERILFSGDGSGEVTESLATSQEADYLSGVTGGIQTNLAARATVIAANFLTNWANAISNRLPIPLLTVTNNVILTNQSVLVSCVSNLRHTATIPAGVLRDGSTIRTRMHAVYNSTANAGGHLNNTNALWLGGVIVATNTVVNFASMVNEPYIVDVTLTVLSNGAGGLVVARGFQMKPTASGAALSQRPWGLVEPGITAVNLSGAVTLDFTSHFSNTTSLIIRQLDATLTP